MKESGVAVGFFALLNLFQGLIAWPDFLLITLGILIWESHRTRTNR